MHILKKIAIYFISSIFTICLFLLPTTFLCTFIFSQAGQVKKIISDSGAYPLISETVIKTTVSSVENSGQTYGLSDSAVKRAAQKAFPASDIRQKSETNINSMYAWLDGKKTAYSVELNLESNQQAFTRELASEATNQMAAKPACNYEQTLQQASFESANLLQSPCQPYTIDAQYLQQLFSQAALQAEKDPNSSLSGFTQLSESSQSTSDTATPFNPQSLFGLLKNSFYITIGLLIISLLLMFALIRSVRTFLLAIAKRLGIAGVILLLYAWFTYWLLGQHAIARMINGVQGDTIQAIAQPFAELSASANLYFGIGYVLMAVVLFVLSRLKTPKRPAGTSVQPTTVSSTKSPFEQ
jgi:hypothetical protein